MRYTVISRERHAAKKWQRPANYAFASAEAIAMIGGTELVPAALCMPCAFVKQAGVYALVALMSPAPGRNMFVTTDGRWIGAYVPACVRFYPFRVVPGQATANELVLCVDEDSGLVVDASAPGEEFFSSEGQAAPTLQKVFDALTAIERSRKATEVAVAALADADVIRPWPISIKTGEGEQPVSGLYRVEEAVLRGLPDDRFLTLRNPSGLSIAYAQMLSMGQLSVFQHLARLHSQPAAPLPAELPETLDAVLENLKGDLLQLR